MDKKNLILYLKKDIAILESQLKDKKKLLAKVENKRRSKTLDDLLSVGKWLGIETSTTFDKLDADEQISVIENVKIMINLHSSRGKVLLIKDIISSMESDYQIKIEGKWLIEYLLEEEYELDETDPDNVKIIFQ